MALTEGAQVPPTGVGAQGVPSEPALNLGACSVAPEVATLHLTALRRGSAILAGRIRDFAPDFSRKPQRRGPMAWHRSNRIARLLIGLAVLAHPHDLKQVLERCAQITTTTSRYFAITKVEDYPAPVADHFAWAPRA
jgi:hypothetical protein